MCVSSHRRGAGGALPGRGPAERGQETSPASPPRASLGLATSDVLSVQDSSAVGEHGAHAGCSPGSPRDGHLLPAAKPGNGPEQRAERDEGRCPSLPRSDAQTTSNRSIPAQEAVARVSTQNRTAWETVSPKTFQPLPPRRVPSRGEPHHARAEGAADTVRRTERARVTFPVFQTRCPLSTELRQNQIPTGCACDLMTSSAST